MTISVCIPTYNQASYLEQAVRSAALQTVAPLEIIVSDDCSNDKTPDVLKKLQNEIPNLKVFIQPHNLGIAKNTDFCLRAAKGEYIVRLDSDDYLSSEFCKILSQALEKYPEAGYAHAVVQEVNENNKPRKLRKLFRNAGFEPAEQALQAAAKGYKVAANIIMFRKLALSHVNYLAGRPEYVEDYHLSVALAAAGYGNVYVLQLLSYYRVWTDAGKVRQRRKLAEIVGLQKVFTELLEPSYLLRGWNQSNLIKVKEQFACNHAECLGWDVYNEPEKDELQSAINNLSQSPKVKLYSKIYRKGWGKPILLTKSIVNFLKTKAKAFLKLNIS